MEQPFDANPKETTSKELASPSNLNTSSQGKPTIRLNILPENPEHASSESVVSLGRFPKWLHRKLPKEDTLWKTHDILNKDRLHTVCEEAKCPNLLECYSKKTATFLILGKSCTRACSFCDIAFNPRPGDIDPDEPNKIAESVCKLGLKHVVITMVARDDLEDGGATHLGLVIDAIRSAQPETTIETLTSDFAGNESSLDAILHKCPEIFNHNVETVRRLTSKVRHKATYERSLHVLSYIKKKAPDMMVKSGIMVGLGEEKEEVKQTLLDLKTNGIDIVTIGQYLQASQKKVAVKEFIHPDLFEEYKEYGLSIGIPHMYTGPFVRSSYNAALFVKNKRIDSI